MELDWRLVHWTLCFEKVQERYPEWFGVIAARVTSVKLSGIATATACSGNQAHTVFSLFLCLFRPLDLFFYCLFFLFHFCSQTMVEQVARHRQSTASPVALPCLTTTFASRQRFAVSASRAVRIHNPIKTVSPRPFRFHHMGGEVTSVCVCVESDGRRSSGLFNCDCVRLAKCPDFWIGNLNTNTLYVFSLLGSYRSFQWFLHLHAYQESAFHLDKQQGHGMRVASWLICLFWSRKAWRSMVKVSSIWFARPDQL